MSVFISICIPAYKRSVFLKRLLDSIVVQSFRDFEVIITDDSTNDEVSALVENYKTVFPLTYKKNTSALGTPENWNESIRLAKGEWIKLMHDDDWFASPESLNELAKVVNEHPETSFFFCAYKNVLENDKTETVFVNSFRLKKLYKNPLTLLSSNVIGPPSAILHRNDQKIWYDKNVKWVVDIDFYIRCLNQNEPVYIDKPLINVGIGKEQVTQSTFGIAEVQIPEHFYLLNKLGDRSLKNVFVYDAWWRLFRNLEIKDVDQISNNGYSGKIPKTLVSMINWQSKIPSPFLKMGVVSKTLMFLNYIRNLSRI